MSLGGKATRYVLTSGGGRTCDGLLERVTRYVRVKSAGKDGGMRKGKTYIWAAILLVAILAIMAAAVACGGDEGTTDAESSAPPSGSAMERATAILGHEPTGLALEIVNAGEVIVANDSNYAPQSSVDPVTKEVVGFDVDVAKGMAEILGLGIKWEHPAWRPSPAASTTAATTSRSAP